MSALEGKPTDYEHAVAIIGAWEAINAELCEVLRKIVVSYDRTGEIGQSLIDEARDLVLRVSGEA